MVAIVLLQEGVGKEPTTWRFELKNSASLLFGPQGGKWVATHPQAHGRGRKNKEEAGGGGREEIERKKDGQESDSPSWCRVPHGALLTHTQRFESPAPAWVTLKQIPAWHSALSSRSREIDQGKESHTLQPEQFGKLDSPTNKVLGSFLPIPFL